jgi:hypothetical protein
MPLGQSEFTFASDNLSKDQFLASNRRELDRLVVAVDDWLRGRHGPDFKSLTAHDAWVLIYCEAGLKGSGLVDSDHRHSLGERGLLPLPATIRQWNGDDAPVWNRPMPLAVNMDHFLRYLGQLKNKEARQDHGMSLYPALFKQAGISGNADREARVLAGVVHGYFYPGNYSDRDIPFDDLIDGYKSDRDLSEMLRHTSYKHAGSSVIDNRKKNVEKALQLLAA